jgi:hypothetical protein
VGFCVATRGVMRPPSYEGAAMAQTLCLCRSLILFRRVESGAGLILIAGRDGKLSATLAKNAWRSGRNISLTVVRIRSPVNVFLLASPRWRDDPTVLHILSFEMEFELGQLRWPKPSSTTYVG